MKSVPGKKFVRIYAGLATRDDEFAIAGLSHIRKANGGRTQKDICEQAKSVKFEQTGVWIRCSQENLFLFIAGGSLLKSDGRLAVQCGFGAATTSKN